MVTISQVVQNLLKQQVLLQEAINHDIVSFNKLAKNLKPQIEEILAKKVKHSAIVMALRRASTKFEKPVDQPSFSYSIETIKTDISYIVLEESPTLLSKLEKLYSIIDFQKGGILNLIQGNYEVSIVINHKNKEDVLDVLAEEKVNLTIDDLVSISLTYSKDFLLTPGIIYDITRFIAWENINIIDLVITKTELSIIINKKDLMRCYQTLGRFSENNHKNSINRYMN